MTKTANRAAQPKKLTPREKAEQTMKNYRELKLQKDSISEQMKALEEELHQTAKDNPGWFEDKKTVTLDVYGKIAFVNETQTVFDSKKFDIKLFYTAYPECVDMKVKASAVKGLVINPDVAKNIEKLGLTLRQVEKFQVQPNK